MFKIVMFRNTLAFLMVVESISIGIAHEELLQEIAEGLFLFEINCVLFLTVLGTNYRSHLKKLQKFVFQRALFGEDSVK